MKVFFFLQGKAPKEIHAILTETLACFFLTGLRTYQHPYNWIWYRCFFLWIYENRIMLYIGIMNGVMCEQAV